MSELQFISLARRIYINPPSDTQLAGHLADIPDLFVRLYSLAFGNAINPLKNNRPEIESIMADLGFDLNMKDSGYAGAYLALAVTPVYTTELRGGIVGPILMREVARLQ